MLTSTLDEEGLHADRIVRTHLFISVVLLCGRAYLRYAVTRGLDKTEGHRYGYSRLLDVLAWLLELKVDEVSVYAFSIENFRRSASEVHMLMELLKVWSGTFRYS